MKLIDDPAHGSSIDATRTMYPTALTVVVDEAQTVGASTSTTFGYVMRGEARVRMADLDALVRAGGYFCAPGGASVEARGAVVAIERLGFLGMPLVGSIEAHGRLSYIDGCSDSILCMPPRLGDPVLNHLHFPAGIRQTLHRHPSIRLGVVARGSGSAWGPGWERPLRAGAVFLLEAHETHAFFTSADASMDVIAFHPDSDWGPSDAAHPMLNRTYLAARGEPAR